MAQRSSNILQHRARPLFDIHVDPPTGADLSMVRLLHRNEESFVTFMRRDRPEDDMRNIAQLRVSNLTTRGPKRADLDRDSYFSINGFRRGGTRRTDDLSALNAAFVDLDYYRAAPTMTWQGVHAVIEKAIRDGVLPAPSIVINSGRGAWMLWLLHADDDPARAPTAPTGNRMFLRDINDRLAAIVASELPMLAVDLAATDLSRCVRVPGSLNSKSATRVRYIVHQTPWGSPLTYSIDGLASEVEVQPPTFRRAQKSFQIATLPRDPNKPRRGGATNLPTVLRGRLSEIEKISVARGGFREGHRNNAAMIIAATLRNLKRPPDEIKDRVSAFARECRPNLPLSAIRGALAERRYLFKNTTIAKLLGVTVEEADALGLRHIRPDYRTKRPKPRRARKTDATDRRDAIRQIVAAFDRQGQRELPSLREFVRLLSDRKIHTTVRTIGKDLDLLGIARLRKRGTPKTEARQLLLGR